MKSSLRRVSGWLHAHRHWLLVLAVAMHLSMLLSWRLGFWNRFTFDATATHGRRGWDFYALYQAGHNALSGVSIYESDNDRIDVVVPLYTPYRYLPLPALSLGVALNALSPLWAFRLWVIIIEAILLTCAWLSQRWVRDAGRRATLVAMWLAFTPFYLEIYLGQFSLVQAALILLILLAAEGRLPTRAGALAWIASLLWKQNTALLAPVWLRERRWRRLGAAALAVVATSAPYFLRYPEALAAFSRNLVSGPPGHQLGNLGARQWLYSLTTALAPGWGAGAHQAAQIAWVALILGLCLWATVRGAPDAVGQIALWCSAYFLLYHHVWEHHYVMLLPVLTALYRRGGSPWVLVVWALIAIWTPYRLVDPVGLAAYHAPMRWTPLAPPLVDVLYHASKAAPTLALFAWLVRGLLRRPSRQALP
jgi:hypothetical protein